MGTKKQLRKIRKQLECIMQKMDETWGGSASQFDMSAGVSELIIGGTSYLVNSVNYDRDTKIAEVEIQLATELTRIPIAGEVFTMSVSDEGLRIAFHVSHVDKTNQELQFILLEARSFTHHGA